MANIAVQLPSLILHRTMKKEDLNNNEESIKVSGEGKKRNALKSNNIFITFHFVASKVVT